MDTNIEELYKKYLNASKEYYNTGESSMTDEEFDDLESYLLENGTEEIKQEIRTKIMNSEGNLSEASGLMVSLKKIKYKDQSTISEIFKFFNYKDLEFYMAPKYDGCAIRITKNENKISINTRGGMDVTDKLMKNNQITNIIPNLPKITCGEFIIRKDVFEEKYSDEYDNARNFVSGILSRKEDITNIDINDFVFIPCTDGTNPILKEYSFDDYKHKWEKISRQKFYEIPLNIKKYKSDEFPFMCDGIVISVIVSKRQIKDNYPLNMVAIKFPAPNAQSKVINIDWTQKKSGKLTPVLEIEPTKLEGTTITKVSGMNYSYLKSNHVGVGSLIQFSKSGDIIPIMNKVITRSDNIKLPNIDYYTKGKNIYAVDVQKSVEYKFYCGFKHLQIEGIGPENAYKIGKICDYDIIECFNKERKIDFITELGVDTSVYQKFSSIYDIKTLYIDDVIFILQFDGVGIVNAKKVADLITKRSTDCRNISNDVINNVCRGEGFRKIKDSIYKLSKYGVKVIQRSENNQSLTYEMSGEPPKMTKKDFSDIMKRLYPNSEHTTLNKDTNYLIVDDVNSNTTKANKARKYKIKIVSYKDVISKSVTL